MGIASSFSLKNRSFFLALQSQWPLALMSHYVFTAQYMSVKLQNGFPSGAFKLALKVVLKKEF